MNGNGKGWFEVDRAGLAEVAKRRGMHFIVTEPIQNAWDEVGVTRVDVTLRPVGGAPRARLEVRDDSPDGFRDLADSYMMFRPSYKLANPEQRGRFNIGEKLLLSVADEARVVSTKGSVIFGARGRTRSGKRTEAGSVLSARLRMTREELRQALDFTRLLIPPPGIVTVINGKELPDRVPIAETERLLETEVRGPEGNFKSARRTAKVRVYEALPGEEPHLYEMGIPIDKVTCPWHVDVGQKVPLSVDRASVRYGYRADVEAIAAELMAAQMDEDTARQGWVTQALANVEDDDAVRAIVKQRFGKAVTYDPSAPESAKLALDAGYTVVRGGELPRAAWAVIRRAEALQPASRLFPDGKVRTGPNGVPPVDEADWTPAMRSVARYAAAFSEEAVGYPMAVEFYDDGQLDFAAFCGGGQLIAINVGDAEVGKAVRELSMEQLDALLIHECAHVKEKDHLTHAFHAECCRIGAKIHLWAHYPGEY